MVTVATVVTIVTLLFIGYYSIQKGGLEMTLTVDLIIQTLGGKKNSRAVAAKKLGLTPSALSMMKKRGKISRDIALLCHLSSDIPYTFNPSDYGVDNKGLKLNLETTKKVTTNDSTK